MIYNKELKKIKVGTDCLTCPHFDKKTKKCNGLNKCCFEVVHDKLTNTYFDPITKLPIKIELNKEN